jgi:hypothetical protein
VATPALSYPVQARWDNRLRERCRKDQEAVAFSAKAIERDTYSGLNLHSPSQKPAATTPGREGERVYLKFIREKPKMNVPASRVQERFTSNAKQRIAVKEGVVV